MSPESNNSEMFFTNSQQQNNDYNAFNFSRTNNYLNTNQFYQSYSNVQSSMQNNVVDNFSNTNSMCQNQIDNISVSDSKLLYSTI